MDRRLRKETGEVKGQKIEERHGSRDIGLRKETGEAKGQEIEEGDGGSQATRD